jgi:hypothetical protein
MDKPYLYNADSHMWHCDELVVLNDIKRTQQQLVYKSLTLVNGIVKTNSSILPFKLQTGCINIGTPMLQQQNSIRPSSISLLHLHYIVNVEVHNKMSSYSVALLV